MSVIALSRYTRIFPRTYYLVKWTLLDDVWKVTISCDNLGPNSTVSEETELSLPILKCHVDWWAIGLVVKQLLKFDKGSKLAASNTSIIRLLEQKLVVMTIYILVLLPNSVLHKCFWVWKAETCWLISYSITALDKIWIVSYIVVSIQFLPSAWRHYYFYFRKFLELVIWYFSFFDILLSNFLEIYLLKFLIIFFLLLYICILFLRKIFLSEYSFCVAPVSVSWMQCSF